MLETNRSEMDDMTSLLADGMTIEHGDLIIIAVGENVPTNNRADKTSRAASPIIISRAASSSTKRAARPPTAPRIPRIRHTGVAVETKSTSGAAEERGEGGEGERGDFGDGYEEDMAEMERGISELLGEDAQGMPLPTADEAKPVNANSRPGAKPAKPKSRKKHRAHGNSKMTVRELRFHLMELEEEIQQLGIYVPPLEQVDDDSRAFEGLGKVHKHCNGKGNSRSYRKRRHRENEMILGRLAAHYERFLAAHEEEAASKSTSQGKQRVDGAGSTVGADGKQWRFADAVDSSTDEEGGDIDGPRFIASDGESGGDSGEGW
jgi:hypothetical protein